MTGILDDHCSDTYFAFSLQDSLEKSRRQFLQKHDVCSAVFKRLSFFPKELHTFSKMSHVSTKLRVVNFITCSFFPKELHTFWKMSHVSIKLRVVNFMKIWFFPEELSTFSKMSHVSIKMTAVNLTGLGHPELKNAKITE